MSLTRETIESTANPLPDAGRSEARRAPAARRAGPEIRCALLCALVAAVAVLLAWPVGEIGHNDDWSYCFTARKLAETGQLTFNGWATAMLGLQAYWGALFIKLFGFSFTVLRLSILPLAALCGAVAYGLGRTCGLRRDVAVFASLSIVLSPLFAPQAASFMTDVPGLLFTLAVLWALLSAIGAEPSQAVRRIALGCALAIVGGTLRQTVWIAPLAMLPYIAWLHRDQRATVVAAVLGWLAVLMAAMAATAWFVRQPYAIPESPMVLWSLLRIQKNPVRRLMWSITALALTLGLAMLPAVAATISIWRRKHWLAAGAIALVVVGIAVVAQAHLVAPWMRASGNAVTPIGVLGDAALGPQRPLILPWLVWKVITLPAIVGTGLLIVGGFQWLRCVKPASHRVDRARVTAMGLLGLAYLMVLLPRCAHVSRIFDRYLLMLMPLVLIPLLLAWQSRRAGARIPVAAWALLIVYGAFAIAITQEVHALGRARVAAAERLRAAGVPREQIDAGYEYNAWSELEISGYYHDSRIRRPDEARSPIGASLTPNVRPRYRVAFGSARVEADERETSFGEVEYSVYLPPIHRKLVIREKKDPATMQTSRLNEESR